MQIRSIRARLTLWYTSLLTVTFLLLGGTAYGLLMYTLTREMDAALNSVGQALADQAPRGFPTLFPPDVDQVFRRFFGFSPFDRYVEMRDRLGRRDPRWPQIQSGRLPLSPTALQNAAKGVPTLETVKGLGPYPVRVVTMPVVEA
ncbi:MAG: hypothetical protein ACE5G5_02930, partial [Candidatus Methylomirabilales bacterium]